eukprot:8910570-Heterocapsa_arctica.AAC.1
MAKKVLVNWLRQIEGGIPDGIAEMLDKYAAYTGNARGPVNYFRREINNLGWVDNTPTNFTDHKGQTREINE